MHIHATIIARNRDCQQLCAQALVPTRNSITQHLNARRPQRPGVRFVYGANTLTINQGIPSHSSNLGTPWWPGAGRGGNRSRLRSTGTKTTTKMPSTNRMPGSHCSARTLSCTVQAKTRCRKTETLQTLHRPEFPEMPVRTLEPRSAAAAHLVCAT